MDTDNSPKQEKEMNRPKVPPPIVKEVKLDAKAMQYLRNISATATMIRMVLEFVIIAFGVVCFLGGFRKEVIILVVLGVIGVLGYFSIHMILKSGAKP